MRRTSPRDRPGGAAPRATRRGARGFTGARSATGGGLAPAQNVSFVGVKPPCRLRSNLNKTHILCQVQTLGSCSGAPTRREAAGRGAGRGGPARRKRARPGRQWPATTEPRGRARRKNGAAPAARRPRRAGRPSREPRGDATPAARRPRPAAEVAREGAAPRGEASREATAPQGRKGSAGGQPCLKTVLPGREELGRLEGPAFVPCPLLDKGTLFRQEV